MIEWVSEYENRKIDLKYYLFKYWTKENRKVYLQTKFEMWCWLSYWTKTILELRGKRVDPCQWLLFRFESFRPRRSLGDRGVGSEKLGNSSNRLKRLNRLWKTSLGSVGKQVGDPCCQEVNGQSLFHKRKPGIDKSILQVYSRYFRARFFFYENSDRFGLVYNEF